MKNCLGTEESLELFNKDGRRVYRFNTDSEGYSWKRTYDSNGNELTFKDSTGYSWESTFNEKRNVLTYKNSNGYSWESTFNEKGNELTFKDSTGYSWERTYDSNGNILTYKDSNGNSRGFDIPEYTMEQLVLKLGEFKIKK